MAAEPKVGRNKLMAEQAEWLARFRAAGVPAFCWRPDDWRDRAINGDLPASIDHLMTHVCGCSLKESSQID